ncbi:prepilin-type N-terminal cleavage/methylation domain-containing protein [Candidatus Nomurabacteria bacterium]|nr:prepilin-type N-terminal cleavage/methylation domain-containing protein [Candidatus Nomurabacteria bacterium]
MILTNFFYKKGITAIELLVVLAILVILLAIVVPQFSKTRESQVLKSAVSDILSSIDKARAETLSSLNSSEYGVHFEFDRIVIFKGKVYSASAGDNEIVSITAPASINNVALGGVSGASGNMYFSRLYGIPSATGMITVSTSDYSKIITIYATGVASTD